MRFKAHGSASTDSPSLDRTLTHFSNTYLASSHLVIIFVCCQDLAKAEHTDLAMLYLRRGLNIEPLEFPFN